MSVHCIELLHRGARATGVCTGICTWAVTQIGVYLTVTSIGKVMVASVLPYSDYTTCKYRHSTYQHRLVVGFVSDNC